MRRVDLADDLVGGAVVPEMYFDIRKASFSQAILDRLSQGKGCFLGFYEHEQCGRRAQAVNQQPDELEWRAQTGIRLEDDEPLSGGCQNVPSSQTDPNFRAGQRRVRWKYRVQQQSLFPERQRGRDLPRRR